jgi:hypothetical protein
MVDFLKLIDFSKEIKSNPEIAPHIEKVAKELSESLKDNEEYRQPFLNKDFSNLVICIKILLLS